MDRLKEYFRRAMCLQWRPPFFKTRRELLASTLPGLPIELIKDIAAFLPPHSVASLTLTSKQMLHDLGTESWDHLNQDVDERKVFIHLLERDLPDYYAGPHLMRQLPCSFPSNYEKDSKHHYDPTYGWFLPHERFGYAILWPHVVLALKQHAYGVPHGISLDAFAFEADQRSEPPGYRDYDEYMEWRNRPRGHTVHLSTLSRIVSGHLLLRCTYTVSNKQRPIGLRDLKILGLEVCRHVGTNVRGEPWFDNNLAKALRAKRSEDARVDWIERRLLPVRVQKAKNMSADEKLDQLRQEEEENINNFLGKNIMVHIRGQCTFCYTEWAVLEAAKPNAIEIVAWHDLGTGKLTHGVSWDVNNTHWQALVGSGVPQKCAVRFYSLDSIHNAFEIGDGSQLPAK